MNASPCPASHLSDSLGPGASLGDSEEEVRGEAGVVNNPCFQLPPSLPSPGYFLPPELATSPGNNCPFQASLRAERKVWILLLSESTLFYGFPNNCLASLKPLISLLLLSGCSLHKNPPGELVRDADLCSAPGVCPGVCLVNKTLPESQMILPF